MAFIATVTVLGFWHTLAALAAGMEALSLTTYLPAALVLVLIAAGGVSLRFHSELPIYDRQTDVIVGGVLLLVALAMSGLMTGRFAQTYLFSQIDVLPMGVFVVGSCIMLFGLRPAGRYRWVWVLGLFFMPAPYRLVVLSLGGSNAAAAAVMIAFTGAATAVATGRTRRRGLTAALIAMMTGVATVVALLVFTDAKTFVYQTVPSLTGAIVACAVMYVDHRRGLDSWAPLSRPSESLKVRTPVRSGLFILAVATGIFFVPIPVYNLSAGPLIHGFDTRDEVPIPAGWRLESAETYGWVSRLYGPRASLTRDYLVQNAGSPLWDNESRPRRIVVDSIVTDRPGSLAVYPPSFVYRTSKFRTSNPQLIDLPAGLTGKLRTVIDDEHFLTYNLLSWIWRDSRLTERVTLMSVDDHRPTAVFLRPESSLGGNVAAMFTILFRGNAVTQDSAPQFKDRALLLGLADQIIAAQTDSPPGGDR